MMRLGPVHIWTAHTVSGRPLRHLIQPARTGAHPGGSYRHGFAVRVNRTSVIGVTW